MNANDATRMLVQILEKTVSPDQNELTSALQYLEQAAVSNFTKYIKSLSEVLVHVGHSPVARMASGLQLKNLLTSKDQNVKTQHQQRWLMLPEDIRGYVKKNVLGALGTENSRPSSAAQCVAYIAVIELPHNQWGDVIITLVGNVTGHGGHPSTESVQEASLQAIGYICADIEPGVLVAQSNQILTAIIHGMKRDEPSSRVRLAATNALFDSLEFTKSNFDRIFVILQSYGAVIQHLAQRVEDLHRVNQEIREEMNALKLENKALKDKVEFLENEVTVHPELQWLATEIRD